jgi:hypothetical protein
LPEAMSRSSAARLRCGREKNGEGKKGREKKKEHERAPFRRSALHFPHWKTSYHANTSQERRFFIGFHRFWISSGGTASSNCSRASVLLNRIHRMNIRQMTNWGHSFICIRYLPFSVSSFSCAAHARAFPSPYACAAPHPPLLALSKLNRDERTKCICSNMPSQSAFRFFVIMSVVHGASDTTCTTERGSPAYCLAFFICSSVYSLLPSASRSLGQWRRRSAPNPPSHPIVALTPLLCMQCFDVVARLALALSCCSRCDFAHLPMLTLLWRAPSALLAARSWALLLGFRALFASRHTRLIP